MSSISSNASLNFTGGLSQPPNIQAPSDFVGVLKEAVKNTDQLQSDADLQLTSLLQGQGQDVHGALIAVEKADVAFQLMMQVRNKIVNAYQEISRMQF